MSSDDYFDEDEQLDSAFFAEVDAIEAAHKSAIQRQPSANAPSSQPLTSSRPATSPTNTQPRNSTLSKSKQITSKKVLGPINVDADEFYDEFLDDIDAGELERLDKDVQAAYNYVPGRIRTSSDGTFRQLNLFGEVVAPASSKPSRAATQQGSSRTPHSPRRSFGRKAQKVKKWDHSAFAKTGWMSGNSSKGKGKARAVDGNSVSHKEFGSTEEFEQFPAPFVQKYLFRYIFGYNCSRYSCGCPCHILALAQYPTPFKHKPDLLAAQHWIYPTNQSKRDYQFNIVRDSLFENTLVSLPTGLGKTFIAGVVMLNYYRWFPDGKVVFVAPTKPLVAQQVEACHKTCGIPGGDAAELTGETAKPARAKAWAEKRVFYMTPQTFMNDLKTENCDPTDIILLVVDEAHKATGDYAYAQVVRYLMAKNAHFRVLALTATPGAKPEAVQKIVDSLHISSIEIRDENSIDLRQYILPKTINKHIIRMTPEIIKIRDILTKLMQKTAKSLVENGLLPGLNAVTLHTYRCNALMQQYGQDGTSKRFPWVFVHLKKLSVMARAMGHLLECSIPMCHEILSGLTTELPPGGKKPVKLHSEPLFRELIKELERLHNSGYPLHPKQDKLQSLTVNYFVQASTEVDGVCNRLDPSGQAVAPASNTKMMVFTTFRTSVDEIVELLNKHQPMIRATRFIGQGVDKRGNRGIAQKEQLEVIKKFKEGVYNVLVATSIGEEGLDIGEVDMIICYDAQKTPLRMLQRIGRTGRQRAGRVEVLLAEAREESNWEKAIQDYETVQASITRGEDLELYADVERLLPDSIKPKCLETHMAIEEYSRDTKPSKAAKASTFQGTKRKRNDDVMRNIPEGAINGFIPSSKLTSKRAPKKRKITSRESDPDQVDDDDDDDDDAAIEAGIHGFLEGNLQGKGKAKAKSTLKVRKPTDKALRKQAASSANGEMTLSQVEYETRDDSDDMEIELGVGARSFEALLPDAGPSKRQFLPSPSASPISIRSSPLKPHNSRKGNVDYPSSPQLQEYHSAKDHSWLLDSDGDDIKVLENISPSKYFSPSKNPIQSSKLGRAGPTTPIGAPEFGHSPLSHVPSEKRRKERRVPSPPLPVHASTTSTYPEPTFVPRRPGVRRKRARVPSSPLESQPAKARSPSSASSQPVSLRKRQAQVDPRAVTGLLDLEAQVSGDEMMSDSSDGDDVENESDRRFLRELDPTQASPNYKQTQAYQHSLFTQAPPGLGGPQFASKLVRRGAFGPTRQNGGQHVSSSPVMDPTSDHYSMDSFLVEDDDDVLLIEDSHSSDI